MQATAGLIIANNYNVRYLILCKQYKLFDNSPTDGCEHTTVPYILVITNFNIVWYLCLVFISGIDVLHFIFKKIITDISALPCDAERQ